MFVLFLFGLTYCSASSDDFYLVPKTIDVDEILLNDRLTRNYLDCILEKGRCTSEGEHIRRVIPEVLEDECFRCNADYDVASARKVLRHLIVNKPQWWREVIDKYDPRGEYKKKYITYLSEEGLNY